MHGHGRVEHLRRDSSEAESIATIHAALDHGVNVLDTGDFYSTGKNELLIGKAIADRRDRALLSVKFGALRGPDGAWLGFDARPVAVKNAIGHSLTRLGGSHIDIYRPARLDPQVPIEDTIGAIADLVKAGYVRYIALSELGADSIRRAAAVHPIVDLQIEYSLISRGPEATILPTLRELGIATTAYGVLSRGLLAGSKPAGPRDFRAHMPRFAGDNAIKNQPLIDALAAVAAARGVSPAQLAIAWVRAKSVDAGAPIVPTMGCRSRAQLADALAGLDLALDPSEVAALEAAVPASAVAGTSRTTAQTSVRDRSRRSWTVARSDRACSRADRALQ